MQTQFWKITSGCIVIFVWSQITSCGLPEVQTILKTPVVITDPANSKIVNITSRDELSSGNSYSNYGLQLFYRIIPSVASSVLPSNLGIDLTNNAPDYFTNAETLIKVKGFKNLYLEAIDRTIIEPTLRVSDSKTTWNIMLSFEFPELNPTIKGSVTTTDIFFYREMLKDNNTARKLFLTSEVTEGDSDRPLDATVGHTAPYSVAIVGYVFALEPGEIKQFSPAVLVGIFDLNLN